MTEFEDAIERHQYPHTPGATYDFLVFIGRFQPFHLGHQRVIQQALKQASNVIVLVGSSHAARSHRNPWTFQERAQMILGALDSDAKRCLTIAPLEDIAYNNNAWIEQVQRTVDDAVADLHDFATTPRIGLIGHAKDSTSFYLRLFPQWDTVQVRQPGPLAATVMREGIFSNICDAWLTGSSDCVPTNVRDQIAAFTQTEDYKAIRDEYLFIREFRQTWIGSPYPPTFVTTDAVVVQAGHVLLIERGQRPGKGLLALPGGYLGKDQTIEDSMIRELREETRIRVPDAVLRGSIVGVPRVFDDPHRDPRGRFITHGFLIALTPRREDGFKLPKVRGSDDAAKATWVPQSEIRRDALFQDHHDIILNLTAQL